MNGVFRRGEWNRKPPAAEKLKDGLLRVTRNVTETTVQGEGEGAAPVTLWTGEVAIMTEAAYAAYVGAMEVEQRREAEVIDDYTLALIEEGVL